MKQVVITMPYEPEGPGNELDPGERGTDLAHALEDLKFMLDTAHSPEFSEAELERVFTATAGLYALRAGTFAECLSTAIVWERG